MPIPSEVPTSFVPHTPMRPLKRPTHFDSSSVLAFASAIVFVLALLATIAIFLYGYYLNKQLTSKQAELHTTQQAFNQATIATYSRTSQQLASAATLLDKHVTASRLFDLLEAKTVQNIQFTSLSLIIQKDQTAKLNAKGKARDFGALVVESRSLLGDKNLSNVVFSNIEPAKGGTNNTINFSVSATVSQSVVANFSALVGPSVEASTTTQSTAVASSTTSTTTTP